MSIAAAKKVIKDSSDRMRQFKHDDAMKILHDNRDILIEAALLGDIESMLEMARLTQYEEKEEESLAWMDRAENVLVEGDAESHKFLAEAYSIGLGRMEDLEFNKRRNYHLLRAAEAGDTMAQLEVAINYLYGGNGFEESVPKFEYWIGVGVAKGIPVHLCNYVQYLHVARRDIPEDLLESMKDLEDSYVPAKLILEEIRKSRMKPRRKPRRIMGVFPRQKG